MDMFYEIIFCINIFVLLNLCLLSINMPVGKLALKWFDYKLDKITSRIKIEKIHNLHFDKKGVHFRIRVEKIEPVEALSCYSVYYKNVYINDELVCRLWCAEKTFLISRVFEHTDKRLESELYSLVNAAYKETKRISKRRWKEFNKSCTESINKKSYFTKSEDKSAE